MDISGIFLFPSNSCPTSCSELQSCLSRNLVGRKYMKTRVSLTLFLIGVLTLSTFAQQPNSSTTAIQATTPETATGQPPLPVPYKAENWWDGDDPGLAWLILHP